jgi:hypothetical protein
MLDKKHLHIDENDVVAELIGKALHCGIDGQIGISVSDEQAVKIRLYGNKIDVDLVKPEFFRVESDETGLFDKLKTASEFGRKLADNDVTISFLRNGKEAVRLGESARPTLSKIITRSDDIQVTSLGEFMKLKEDFKKH